MMENNWDLTFLKIAHLIAEHSTCAKRQVGAILVKNRRILSTGYNGVPAGIKPHCNEIYDPRYFKIDFLNQLRGEEAAKTEFIHINENHRKFQIANEIHAEINTLLYAARNGISTENSTIYLTLSPCADCVKAIIASGVSRIVYDDEYDDLSGMDLLKLTKITYERIFI